MVDNFLQDLRKKVLSQTIAWVSIVYLLMIPLVGASLFLDGVINAGKDTELGVQNLIWMHLKQILALALLSAGLLSWPSYKYGMTIISWALLAIPPLILAYMVAFSNFL